MKGGVFSVWPGRFFAFSFDEGAFSPEYDRFKRKYHPRGVYSRRGI